MELMVRRVEAMDEGRAELFDENGVMVQQPDPLKRIGKKALVAQQKRGDPMAPHRWVALVRSAPWHRTGGRLLCGHAGLRRGVTGLGGGKVWWRFF